MKNSITSYLALAIIINILLGVSPYENETLDFVEYSANTDLALNYTVSPYDTLANDVLTSKEDIKTFSLYLGKSFVGFKEALGFRESGGDYNSVNTFGYLGKYQFGKSTLKMIGINNPNKFLKDPALQEKAFIANAARNKWILRRDIKNFVGKHVNGVLVTESGILAAAHLAGPGSVKKYLRSYGLNNFADGYGTTVQNYMKQFSGYDTSFVKPNRLAKAIKI